MERGVYAQCWIPRSHCYHPSLPPRRLKNVEDFRDYQATMLSWPCLGGGGISLPYLAQEADGFVPLRYRQYGFLNDREFISECQKRGVKAFSVIFCLQGWEFPAEFNDGEDEVLSLNELKGVGKRGWLGLREFTQDRYPKIWGPFESYFPGGLQNSDGERVADLWEECCSRDIHGGPIHADWLECPDREHECHLMDSNNPVWREYLKAVIRLHVDAGVDGIQFDEPDSPIAALRYGGCFCKDCMKGFRDHLRGLPEGVLPPEVVADLGRFHYGEWLQERGAGRIEPRQPDVLAREYASYQRGCTARNFKELAGYVREYAGSVGRQVLVSANLFDGAPYFDPPVADVDILVPEQRNTLYQQPAWMRYISGFGGEKPVVIEVNPYGGVLMDLAADLRKGDGADRYRTMLYEAATFGVNLAVPYGAWMGSVVEDAFYGPHDVTVEVESFLAEREELFSRESFNAVAVVFSVESNFMDLVFGNIFGSDPRFDARRERRPPLIAFEGVTKALSGGQQPFDVLMFHDGVLRADDVAPEVLGRYRCVLLPGCKALTGRQVAALVDYLNSGGTVIVVGEVGSEEGEGLGRRIVEHSGAVVATEMEAVERVTRIGQVRIAGTGPVGVNIQRTDRGAALHVVNYDFDDARGCTRAAVGVEVEVAVPFEVSSARVYRPGKDTQALVAVPANDGRVQLSLGDLHWYAIVELLR